MSRRGRFARRRGGAKRDRPPCEAAPSGGVSIADAIVQGGDEVAEAAAAGVGRGRWGNPLPAPKPPIGPEVVEDASLIRRGLAGKTDLKTGVVSINPRVAAVPKLANRVKWHEWVHWLPGGDQVSRPGAAWQLVRDARDFMWRNSAINRVVEESIAAGVDSFNPITAMRAPFATKLVRDRVTGEVVKRFAYSPFRFGTGDAILTLPLIELIPSDSKSTQNP